MQHANPDGAAAIVRRLDEARTRGLWVTRRNSTEFELERALAGRAA
jgi:cobalamin biosynthesis Mg chelatase CobN